LYVFFFYNGDEFIAVWVHYTIGNEKH